MADHSFSSFVKFVFGFAIIRKIVPFAGTFLFVLYAVFFLWTSFGPQKNYPNLAKQRAVKVAVKKIVEEIRENRGNIREVVMLHFYNDPTDFFSDTLRNALNSSGVLNLEDMDFSEKFCKQFNIRIRGTRSAMDALQEVRHCDVDGVLWGVLDLYESSSSGVVLTGEWYIIDKRSRQEIYRGTIRENTAIPAKKQITSSVQSLKEKTQESTAMVGYTALSVPWYIRFMGFILLALLLPIITISFIRTMVAKQSNRINAFVLIIYTFIDAIFAFFMVGGGFTSAVSVFFFLTAVLLAFFYNVYLMTFALRLEEK